MQTTKHRLSGSARREKFHHTGFVPCCPVPKSHPSVVLEKSVATISVSLVPLHREGIKMPLLHQEGELGAAVGHSRATWVPKDGSPGTW